MEVITVSQLRKRSNPCTSASSLHHTNPSRAKHKPFVSTTDNCEKYSTFSTIEVLDTPSVLIGRVVLPSEARKCPSGNDCLLFLDVNGDSGDWICCDFLSFDVGVVNNEIRVCSWNYILVEEKGGVLEIISWEFLETRWMRPCSSVSSLQLESIDSDSVHCVDDPKAKYFVHGFVEAVSPVKVQRVEDKENDGGSRLSGFLVEIMRCKCKLCKLKDSDVVFRNLSKGGSSSDHCYDECVTVYFFGTMSTLHPVITKLVGNFVFLSYLRKKMVFIGGKECQLMYVTTKKSSLRVMKLIKRKLLDRSMSCKGKSKCGMYMGVIKAIYEQGRIMELDDEVWLLFSDISESLPHSFRVGAVISVHNVHFVKCKFSWTKKLILGGCVRTTINLKRFSPLNTCAFTYSQSPNQIGKFIDSLAFSEKLWVLLIVASFRNKFAGIFSLKKIMGSKHSKGLAQIYATYHLPSSNDKPQREIFMDFCHHNSSKCTGEADNGHLNLVLPISKLIHMFGYSQQRKDMSCLLPYSEGDNHQSIRRIVCSEDINVVLVGKLQITSSGQLQLVDATGSIDIVIQNLPFNLKPQNIYEVTKYNLLTEILPAVAGTFVLKNNTFSFRHIFQYSTPPKVDTVPCVLCHMENVNIVNNSTEWDNDLNILSYDTFDLLKLTHKFPRLLNADPADDISMFAEVAMLPWRLVVTSRCPYSLMDCEDQRTGIIHHIQSNSDKENSCNKRRKCDYVPPNGLCSSFEKMNGTIKRETSSVKVIHLQGCDSSCPVQLPCTVHTKSRDNQNRVLPGFLNHVNSGKMNGGGHSTLNERKFLLEFKSDSFLQFEALTIGSYYILKNEESCAGSKSNFFTKVVITQAQKIMSLSFAYTESFNSFSPENVAPMESCNDVDIHSNGFNQIEIISLRCHTPCFDFEVHLPSEYRGLLEGDPKHFQEGYFKSLEMPDNISSSLPVGNLISFHGQVMAVLSSDQESTSGKATCVSFGGSNQIKCPQWSYTCLKIHVLTRNKIVKVLTCIATYSFPIGFGPGVDAHFHRILHSRSDHYLITPVSFVEIISIRTSTKYNGYEQSNLSCASKSTEFSTLTNVASGLIHHIMLGSESEPHWIRCRVFAVHILVLEKNDLTAKDLDCKLAYYPDIPLAGFILDDGSFTCCCWSNANKAAALLKINEEVPCQAIENRSWNDSKATLSTASHHLNKILTKQGRIVVKNYGSACESIDTDLAISITSPRLLDRSDEEMIKYVVINACAGKPLNVLVSVMDPDAVQWLERHTREMEMTMPLMPHMWAKEVCSPNPLDEARALFHHLV